MWSTNKTNEGQDLVWSGPEFGVASSALKGTANLQNVNIATEPGQVMAAYARTAQQQAAISGGTLTPDGATNFDDAAGTLKSGTWIKVTASTVTSITAATNPTTVNMDYLVVGGGGPGGSAQNNTQNGGGGGGGGGDVVTGSSVAFDVQAYTITVGTTKTGPSSISKGSNGNTSYIYEADGTLVDSAEGGGAGGVGVDNVSPTTNYDGNNRTDAGAGGGGAADGNAGTGGTSTNGGNGGAGYDGGATVLSTGGGGGSSANAGGAGASDDPGDGAAGTASSITGVSVTYGGGGAGGGDSAGVAGSGGGGASGTGSAAGGDGTDGLGGGGGGAASKNNTIYQGGDGGSGVIIISYTTGSALCIGGEVSYTATNTVHKFTSDGVFEVLWINPGGYYYVNYKDDSDKVQLSTTFDPYGDSSVSHGTTGSITFDTVATPGKAIDKAVEKYVASTGTEYRYYVLDDNGRTWHYDTQVYDDTLANNNVGVTWILADPSDYSSAKPKGIDILNGWLFGITSRRVLCKPTVTLGQQLVFMYGGWLTNATGSHPNYAYTGSQGTLLYTDKNFIGEIFPTTSLITSVANLQSYATYTATTTTGTIATLIGGSIPSHVDGTRLPVVFFTSPGGVLPTAITANTVYYIQYNFAAGTFGVYEAITGGSALDIATGASGTQYFNSFFPIGSDAGANGTNPTLQFSPQRLNLPFYEVAQKLVEVDNGVFIGCKSNIIYPWNQVDAVPSNIITLPESDVATMLNVNNTCYVFAGDKGNIYLVNGVAATLVLTIPDYTAGVPGTPNSYIEPTFVWGDAIFCRGRVYCSVLDQTSTKAGNCGGIWSFIPSENVDPNQEVGSALRLENQSSYGDYDGYCPVLIVDEEQNGQSPKYWSFWQDSYDAGSPGYGIDYSSSNPVTTFVVETDLLRTGTNLTQRTFKQVEYKLAVPPTGSDAIDISYRSDPTGSWTALAGKEVQTSGNVHSGVYPVNFEKTEWLQFRAVGTTSGSAATSTFTPLTEIRLR